MECADPLVQLHEEVINFYHLMQPTSDELANIANVLARLNVVVRGLWPDATLQVFGSVETGLWLPNSDIDIVVFTAYESDPAVLVNTLASALQKIRFASELERILTARVPLVKLRDRTTSLCLDISFNMENGVEGVKVVKDYLRKYPEAKYLVCVLKYFLKQRGLNETYNGGVGSFLLFCMAISAIQQHPSRRSDSGNYERYTLAHYLLHFLRLYGDLFNFERVGISLRKHGHYFDKRQKGWFFSERKALLALECPQNSANDLGRNSFGIDLVRKAFSHAYKLICACGESRRTTPLQTVIKLDTILAGRAL
jgi:non-canonical poly(A) RNA polymerase PAPD5/7